ncbi:hypothetical protein B7463_g4445, partial [Scytalidium lignicola]
MFQRLLSFVGLASLVLASPTPDTEHLDKRAAVNYVGYNNPGCGGSQVNNGPLNTGCFNLAGATESFSPSGNGNCIVYGYTCSDCNCDYMFSGYATGQCINAEVIQSNGEIYVYDLYSVNVSC